MDSALAVGAKLVELCRNHQHMKAVETLYAASAVSLEPRAGDTGSPQRVEGLAAIKVKNERWLNTHEIHSQEVRGPFPHGDRFIVCFTMDFTPREGPMKGRRMHLDEAGLYTVEGGKIVQEEYFYHVG